MVCELYLNKAVIEKNIFALLLSYSSDLINIILKL